MYSASALAILSLQTDRTWHKVLDVELGKQPKLCKWQIREAKRYIARIQRDWEGDRSIYTADEARARISQERQKIARAEAEKAKRGGIAKATERGYNPR